MLKRIWTLSAVVGLLHGCTNLGDGDAPEQEPRGHISAALQLSDLHGDVTSVRVAVVPSGASCEAPPLFVSHPGLETEALPASLAEGAGSFRPFADALFVLAPGDYRVCATPLAGEQPSAQCGVATADVTVTASQTTEVLLISQCSGQSSGGLDVIVALNQPPHIDAVNLNPGKFISICESLAISVTAEDPNQDPLTYAFALETDAGSLRAEGSQATFSGPAGDYEINVVVSDSHGQATSLSFPVHVSPATCAVPTAVQDLFVAHCSPCHITGASGGLSLASAEASYANLVGRPSSAAACSTRTRVIPGDAGTSYLIAKLRGAADICGTQMPRNRPPLPESDIATISAWIEGLPH